MAENRESVASLVEHSLREARRVLDEFAGSAETIRRVERMVGMLVDSLRAGGKVLVCGNGGSLCDASHFAEELTGRFRKDRPALGAIALSEPGHLTCTANDYGFEHVFSRGVEALGREGDVLIAMSTSGNSGNVVRAVEAAKQRGIATILLLGKDGGLLRGRGDVELVAPGATADRIQELHMLVLHVLVEGVERGLGYA